MRTLVLYRETNRNSYAGFLLKLLLQIFLEQQYVVETTNSINKAKALILRTDDAIIVMRLLKKKFHFFSNLNLSLLIKKQKIKRLVQIANDEIISSHLSSLIVPLNNEKIVFTKTLSSSVSIAVCSHIAKQKITETNHLSSDKVVVFSAAADVGFKPITWSEQQAVKMQYTQGREYFLVTAYNKTFATFMSILKAFSGFKKWQHSSMKLVVTGVLSFTNNEEWAEKISTYKYRDDVVFLPALTNEEEITLLAGAYVFIHTPVADDDVIPVLQAMQCGTPCISFFTESIHEYAADAATLIEPNNYEQLGVKMILLYKDETLRSALIEAGTAKAEAYSKEKAAHQLTSFITKRIST